MSDALNTFFRSGTLRQVAAGATMFRAGDRVEAMHWVETGEMHLLRQTSSGTTLILQRAGPGDIAAEASAYSHAYHCDATVPRAARLRSVPVSAFRRRLDEDPALAGIWAGRLANAVQSARFRAEVRTLRTVSERLDAWLAEGRAMPERGGWTEVAAELGVTREALYRTMAGRRAARNG